MKHLVISTVFASFALAPNAYALKVTNLDTVPHTVVYDSAGKPEEQTIVPNQSINFHGRPDGFLSLKPAGKVVKKPSGRMHADGLLADVVGESRTEDMPASGNYDFVIWPGSRLMIQHHRNGDVF
jgi:hypothetical protein